MESRYAEEHPWFHIYFFADDSLLFARANESEAKTIINILQEVALGQMVNLDKSKVSYSQNVSDNMCKMLRERLGFKEVETHQHYLGLPTYVGRSKKVVFQEVRD